MNRLHFFVLSCLLAACDCGGGVETPMRTCTTNADCPSGQDCIDSMCVGETACTTNSDCGSGETCLDMRCVPGCSTNADCAAGETCNTGICEGSACVDPDMDGYGPGCTRGEEDCDPDDGTQTGVEICDGMDNDCDGEADNGVLSECGDCNPDCRRGTIGGEDDPFMPEEENSEGVGVDPEDGALVLDSRRINTNFIWIANTAQDSVSRFSTTAPYGEVARYFVADDPSRTSINSLGDAFVGSRTGNTLTRISVLGDDCPDTNGDGMITTSRDINGDGVISSNLADGEMMPLGMDDCVLWALGPVFDGENRIRAVAAQDLETPDGELEQFVWVGGYTTNMVAKINAVTGEVIFRTAAPRNPYGFALDGEGKLWVSTRSGSFLGFLDTTTCVDEASCSAAVCTAPSAEATDCDGAVKAIIPAPFVLYGVTVDFEQRVWVGGGGIARYDLSAASGSRWANVALPFSGSIAIHGIAADGEGFVWGAGQGNGVARVDANTLANQVVAGTTGTSNKGMAVDAEGKIWSITQTSEAVVITPGPTLSEATVERSVATSIVNPYTYSDMTGVQLRLATNPGGHYRHIFEGCEMGNTSWGEVRFDADTPVGTTVTFRVRTADTREDLDSADWVLLGTAPPSTSPLDVATALMDAGVTPGRFLMLEVQLAAERSSSTEVITPRVRSMDATHECPPILG